MKDHCFLSLTKTIRLFRIQILPWKILEAALGKFPHQAGRIVPAASLGLYVKQQMEHFCGDGWLWAEIKYSIHLQAPGKKQKGVSVLGTQATKLITKKQATCFFLMQDSLFMAFIFKVCRAPITSALSAIVLYCTNKAMCVCIYIHDFLPVSLNRD